MKGPAYTHPREIRPFDVRLSDEEKRALSSRFAELDDALEAALDAEKERKKAARGAIDDLRAQKRAVRDAMRSGVELRQIPCEWQTREGGERVLVRLDTGEVVETQAQRVLT